MKEKKNLIAICPGAFDPVSFGHIDIVKRGAAMFEQVIVAVAGETNKRSLFSLEERLTMAKECFADIANVKVEKFDGLLVNYLQQRQVNIILRGIRTVTDFEYEFQMAVANKRLDSNIETLFMMTEEIYSYLSSSMIKEIARLGGSVDSMVPPVVAKKIKEKLAS